MEKKKDERAIVFLCPGCDQAMAVKEMKNSVMAEWKKKKHLETVSKGKKSRHTKIFWVQNDVR